MILIFFFLCELDVGDDGFEEVEYFLDLLFFECLGHFVQFIFESFFECFLDIRIQLDDSTKLLFHELVQLF